MSKSVIRSAKPHWIYLILTGKKKVEVGKNFPKSKDWNRVVEMYCSKDMRSFNRIPEKDREWMRKYLGKVIGEFVCDKIDEFMVFQNGSVQYWNYHDLDKTCLAYKDLAKYIGNGKKGYAWHISDLVIYDKPRELGEFKKPCGLGTGCEECDDIYLMNCKNSLSRPPQSWCYVEEG